MFAVATWLSVALVLVLLGIAALALFAGIRTLLNRTTQHVAQAVIRDPEESTVVDRDGAVRSTQGADITMPVADLEELWKPINLERLARTYWRFLTHATLGVIRVAYTDDARYIVLLRRPFVLLSFQAPEYELSGGRGIVRWRIEKGFLVSKAGRGGNGYLEIDVRRAPPDETDPSRGTVHVEVEVANFYPAIASAISKWVYANTQSRIHVVVTHSFLRSLARLDLAESKVGRWAMPDQPLPEPHGARKEHHPEHLAARSADRQPG